MRVNFLGIQDIDMLDYDTQLGHPEPHPASEQQMLDDEYMADCIDNLELASLLWVRSPIQFGYRCNNTHIEQCDHKLRPRSQLTHTTQSQI